MPEVLKEQTHEASENVVDLRRDCVRTEVGLPWREDRRRDFKKRALRRWLEVGRGRGWREASACVDEEVDG